MKKSAPSVVISMIPSKMGMSKHKGMKEECDDLDMGSKPKGKKPSRGGKRGC